MKAAATVWLPGLRKGGFAKALLLLSGIATAVAIDQAAASDAVRCVQSCLAYRGHDPGPADGLAGRRTDEAAAAYAAQSSAGLPAFSQETADLWCAHAENDASYVAFREFDYDGRGILPRDVVFDALNAPLEDRLLACGLPPDYKIDELERVAPVTRISGFNSRMDNWREVEHAREAEAFTADFTSLAVWAFVTENDEVRARLVRLLAKWADAGAFLGTEACVTGSGNLIATGKCAEWRRADGQDLSAAKDATHSTFLMAALVRTYLSLLADHRDDSGSDLTAAHASVRKWIEEGFARRLKQPTSVYFGLNMGWYWPSINLDQAAGRTGQATGKLESLQQGLDRLMLADGSIKERTTRGDRALWYHYTSIGEVVMSLEMMRAAGVPIRPSIEEKLHKAVDLFIRAVDDFSVIHPWARQRHNSSYNGETQDWDKSWWPNNDFAGSWLHVYPYRYPDHPNATTLRQKVKWNAGSATRDIDYGVGVGCIYNLAAGRVPH